jgi:predicted RecA/RadA family phage recombinase
MKNFIQPGDTLTALAPTGGIVSGAALLFGTLFGVAAYTAAEGEEVECAVTGVYELPKTSANVIALGAKVYWNDTLKEVTSTASGNSLIGGAAAAAGAGVTLIRVRLNGVTI